MFAIPDSHFLTAHGESFVMWMEGERNAVNATIAFHVRFADGSRGEARCQQSSMGMIVMERPWRRRRDNSWWPGDLQIFRDRVEWRDHEKLLDLWIPHASDLPRLLLVEFGDEAALPDKQFHWPELYVALCNNSRFLDAVRDNDFAASVHVFFRSHQIHRRLDGFRMLLGSDRRYGDMLGAWRRCGESYLDFLYNLPGNPNSAHDAMISTMLHDAGFATLPR